MPVSNAQASLLNITVGRKILVAVTGLALIGFLIGHLSGNLLLLRNDGGAAFDAYAHFMAGAWFIYIAEAIIFAAILGHIGLALFVSKRNHDARGPVGYRTGLSDRTNPFSKYMLHTGIIFLLFLAIHLWSFFFQHKVMTWLTGAPAAGLPASLYQAARDKFSNPLFSGFYVVSMVALAFHLVHGFWSAFHTLGLNINKRIERTLKRIAVVFAVLVCGGFAYIPLYFLFIA